MKKFENILVAFDLNKTLFYKTDEPVNNYKYDIKIRGLYFYFRPHLKELIQFLHVYKVNYCFWSNMMGKNCLKYVKLLQQMGMKKHCGIFDQQFCDKIEGADQLSIKSIKNLNKLAKQFQIDVDRCILIDDSKQKNVQGCHLIQIKQFGGQPQDKQILRVIEQIVKFRKDRATQNIQNLSILQMTKYKFQVEKGPIPFNKKEKQQYKPTLVEQMKKLTIQQPQSEAQKLILQTPYLKKMKDQLTLLKQQKKQISKQIQENQIKSKKIDQRIKKIGQEAKVIRKGDASLMDLLILAKQKKILEKTTEECKTRKDKCANRMKQIKDQMHKQVQKVIPSKNQHKFQDKTQKEAQQKKKKNKKKKNTQTETKNKQEQITNGQVLSEEPQKQKTN